MKRFNLKLMLLMVGAVLVFSMPNIAISRAASKIPRLLVMASYETGAGMYPWGVAVSNAIEKKTGAKVRIVPTMTDAGKALLLRSKEANYTIIGGGTAWFIYAGQKEFDSPEWGPQPLRILWVGGKSGIGFMTRGDSGIKQISDLKGKGVYYVPGAHGPNAYNEAYLAFGNMSWKDVKQVKMPSYGAALKAIKEGACDAGAASVFTPGARELEASNHGLYWLPVPLKDKEGWKRLQSAAPFFFPALAKAGAGIAKGKPIPVAHYSVFTLAYSSMDDDLAYNITKAVDEGYNLFKNAHNALKAWTMNTFSEDLPQAFMPLHPGTIKYLKEQGRWSPELDKWQSDRLKEEAQRKEAWRKKYKLN